MNTNNNNFSSEGQPYGGCNPQEQEHDQTVTQQAQSFNQSAQPQGYYQPQQAQSFNQGAQPQGYYQPQQAQSFNQNAQPQGYYQPQQAQSFNQSAQPQGYYQPQQAQSFNQGAQPQGYYQPQQAQNFNLGARPQGYYQPQQSQSFNQGYYQPYPPQAYAPQGYTPYRNYTPSPQERLNAQKKHEKKLIRKLGNRTGWSVCAMFVGMALLFYIVYYALYSPYMDYTTLECVSSLVNSIAAMISMFGGGILLLLLTKTKLRDAVTFRRTQSFKRCTAAFLVGLGIIPVCNILAELVASNLTLIGIEDKAYGASTETPEITLFYVLVQVLCVAIVPAISEEFLFRGAILGALKPYGQGFAIVMSSVLFGFVHGNLGQIPFAIAGGIFFAFIRIYTGSLIPSMILHGINNLLSVVLEILNNVCDENVVYAVMIIYYLLFCIIAVIAFAKLARRDKNLLRLERSESKISEREKSVSFMVSPGFITFFALIVIETIAAYFMY